jgi:molecular chaperone GrpE
MIKRKPDQQESRTPREPDNRPEEAADQESAVADLQSRLEDLNNRYLRVLADYQNSQRRALANEHEARRQGIQDVVRTILTVLDHFDLALNQDPAKATPDQIIAGVRVIRGELFKVLQSHGVGVISPAPGDEFQPARHEAILHQQAPGIQPGRIAATLQPGYTLADRVIRPAKVALAPAPESPRGEQSAQNTNDEPEHNDHDRPT